MTAKVGDILLVLITYDVSTTSSAGRRRLRQVAKKCTDYGQRVQNSVFECIVDATQFRKLQYDLQKLIDPEEDSLRFYQLGDNYKRKIDHYGIKRSFDVEGPLIL